MAGVQNDEMVQLQSKDKDRLRVEKTAAINNLRKKLVGLMFNNAVVKASQMSARPWLKDILETYFPSQQTVSLDILIQALTARLFSSSRTDQTDLKAGLDTILTQCAKQGESTIEHESQPQFSRAADLGLDDYLGHDIEPTILMESAAYPTSKPASLLLFSGRTSEQNLKSNPLLSPHSSALPKKQSLLIQDFVLLSDFVSVP